MGANPPSLKVLAGDIPSGSQVVFDADPDGRVTLDACPEYVEARPGFGQASGGAQPTASFWMPQPNLPFTLGHDPA